MTDSENTFAKCQTRSEVLGQLAGASSTCWSTVEGAGVFDSRQAYKFVTDAEKRLEEIQEQEFAKTQGTDPHRLDSVWDFARDVAIRSWPTGVQLIHTPTRYCVVAEGDGGYSELFHKAKDRLASMLTYWVREEEDDDE